MWHLFLLAVFLMNLSAMHGILRRADIVSMLGNKKVFLLHDTHNGEDSIPNQFEIFCKALNENKGKHKFHIMVEQPEQNFIQSQINPTVLTHIAHALQLHNFKNISLQNIEISSKSHGAHFLFLNNFKVPSHNYKYVAGNSYCILDELTFQDIIDEFLHWHIDLTNFVSTITCEQQKELCQEQLNQTFDCFQDLINCLNRLKINTEQPICKLDLKSKFKNFNPYTFIPYILRTFTPLLNLNLLQLLENDLHENIIVIAGAMHLDKVRFLLLQDSNNKWLGSIKNNEETSILNEEDFQKIFSFCLI